MQLAHEGNKCVIAKRAEVPLTPIKHTSSTFISRGGAFHFPAQSDRCFGICLEHIFTFSVVCVRAWVVDLDGLLVEFMTLSRYESCVQRQEDLLAAILFCCSTLLGGKKKRKKKNGSAWGELPALRRPVINEPASRQSLGRVRPPSDPGSCPAERTRTKYGVSNESRSPIAS